MVSGTNIKTINNESILGNGNITIQGGGGETNVIESISVNNTPVAPDGHKNVNITVPADGVAFVNAAIQQEIQEDNNPSIGYYANGNTYAQIVYGEDNIVLAASNSLTLSAGQNGLTIGGTGVTVNGNQVATVDDIPAAVTESTVSGWGFTKNTGNVSSTAVSTIMTITQSAYDALATKDANTLYLITES